MKRFRAQFVCWSALKHNGGKLEDFSLQVEVRTLSEHVFLLLSDSDFLNISLNKDFAGCCALFFMISVLFISS